ncbi:MAG: hypothetical protein WBC97_01370, partial [Gemmatimonadales bacterium]
MFIELTDHLRCPVDHDESYLVLLPDVTDGRSVRTGTLGCPVCQAEYRIEDGVVRFAPRAEASAAELTVSAVAVHALLGLAGPGGFAALVGDVTSLAVALARSNVGVHFAAVRPVAGLVDSRALSLIDADLLPFKRGSLRGVVLGAGYGGDAGWVADAVRV